MESQGQSHARRCAHIFAGFREAPRWWGRRLWNSSFRSLVL